MQFQLLKGNTDKHTFAYSLIEPSIAAKYFRIEFYSWYTFIGLRMEFYGCVLGIDVKDGEFLKCWKAYSITIHPGAHTDVIIVVLFPQC